MDRNRKEASSTARREEAVARRLGYALDRLAPPDAGECPDPEKIAAYEQRALAPEEIAQCESHFAVCPRCREILNLVAAAVPDTADVPLTAHEAAAREAAAQAQPARPPSTWWRSLWLVPALAATAAVALFFFVHLPWRSSERATSPLVAEAPAPPQALPPLPPLPPEAPTAPQPAAAPPPAGPTAPPDQGSASGALSPSAAGRNPEDDAAVSSAAPRAPAPPPAPQAPLEAENYAQAENDARAARPEAPAAAAPNAGAPKSNEAPVPPPQPLRPPAAAAPNADRAVAPSPAPPQLSAVQSRAPNAEQNASAAAAQAGRTPAVSSAASVRAFGALSRVAPSQPQISVFFLSVKSPSSAISWRAGAGGLIQRSSDGGRTWQSQPSPLAEDWLAGSAVSDTVCWLVGRNGAIARTINGGERWQQIPGPPQALAPADASGKPPDWLTISATDARAAVIGSASQRFVTRDAGQTWQPQP